MNQSDGVINDADPNAITINQARGRIFARLEPIVDQETIDCRHSLGRVVACDIISDSDVPSFRASAMDGYALRVSDSEHPLQLSGHSLAGHPGEDHLPPQCAQRITTGARVPDDADAVVQQENVTLENDRVIVRQLPSIGLHIRQPGTDSNAGSILLGQGHIIGPAQCALLAANGISQIAVRRKCRIAIFSTGDELVEAGTPKATGQIYDANRALLMAMLDETNTDVTDLGIAQDSKADIQRIVDASQNADLVISSGGVSVGDADHMKAVLQSNGSMALWKVAMKPGRPLTFGFLAPDKAFFGLPGNPVSAALTCLLFVKPAVNFLCGTPTPQLPPLTLPLRGSLRKNPGRVEYQRARIEQDAQGQWHVLTTGLQDSHVLNSLHQANCLIELPMDSSGAEDGQSVQVIPLTHFSRSPI